MDVNTSPVYCVCVVFREGLLSATANVLGREGETAIVDALALSVFPRPNYERRGSTSVEDERAVETWVKSENTKTALKMRENLLTVAGVVM